MKKHLKIASLQNQIDKKGYVKFPLFDKEEINIIKNFYLLVEKEHKNPNTLFDTTLNTSNRNLIEKTHQFLLPIFEKKLNQYVTNLNFTLAGFLVKHPGEKSAVTIHQDWNYVDESKFSSYSFWVSLDDVSVFNGCMQFIPNSQKFYPSLRVSPDIPDYFDKFKEKAADYLVDVPSKAGECVMFDQALIHASRRNHGKKPRVACILGSYPQEADLLHHYLPEENNLNAIEQYKISVESMISMKKNQRPPFSELLGHVSYTPPKITEKEFINFCKEQSPMLKFYEAKIYNQLLGKSC